MWTYYSTAYCATAHCVQWFIAHHTRQSQQHVITLPAQYTVSCATVMGFKIGFLKTVAFFKWIMVLDGVIETLYVTLWFLLDSCGFIQNCEVRQEGYCLDLIMTPNQIKLPCLFLTCYTPAATVVVLFYFLNQSEPWNGYAPYWTCEDMINTFCSAGGVHYHSYVFVLLKLQL